MFHRPRRYLLAAPNRRARQGDRTLRQTIEQIP
jgi:hypothetical protein